MTEPVVKRRQFLSDAGEPTLLTADPVDYIDRFEAFVDATNIDPSRVLATPLCRFPLPVPKRGEDGKQARWKGVNPAMMWHPLFWLPEHTAFRYKFRPVDPITNQLTDDTEIESDEAWAVRVMFELEFSALYDAATGTWLDVLAYHGLDADNPVDQARVQHWLDGNPDPVLDAIDFTANFVNANDPEWALREAADAVDIYVPAQWSLTATGLIAAIEEKLSLDDSDEEKRRVIGVLGDVAINALRTVPADPITGFDIVDYIGALIEANASPDSDPSYLLESLTGQLRAIANDFEPYVRGIEAAAEEASQLQ